MRSSMHANYNIVAYECGIKKCSIVIADQSRLCFMKVFIVMKIDSDINRGFSFKELFVYIVEARTIAAYIYHCKVPAVRETEL